MAKLVSNSTNSCSMKFLASGWHGTPNKIKYDLPYSHLNNEGLNRLYKVIEIRMRIRQPLKPKKKSEKKWFVNFKQNASSVNISRKLCSA